MARLLDFYKNTVVQELTSKFGYKSNMEVPRITKITLNMGVGEAVADKKVLEHAVSDMTKIAGQKPVVTKSRKSIAGFKIRDGYPIGCMVTLRGPLGWTMAAVVWSIMVAGIALKLLFIDRFRRLLLGAYLAMGWLVVFVLHALWQRLPGAALGWLVAGGLAYTGGVAFYVWKRLPYGHSIWHLFVLGGSVCHFFLFYWHVMPKA